MKKKLVFEISQNKKLGYINIQGNILKQTKEKVSFDDIHPANYVGGIDYDKVIQSEKRDENITYDIAFNFDGEKRALVAKKVGTDSRHHPVYYWGYIDEKNNLAIDCQYIDALPFLKEVALVQESDKSDPLNQYSSQSFWKLIDIDGKEMNSNRYQWAAQFTEELAAVRINDKYGFINLKGEIRVQPLYDWVSDFKNGLARVAIKNERITTKNLENSEGRLIITPDFQGQFGVIDPEGKYIIEPHIDAPHLHFTSEQFDFYDNLAVIEKNGKYGFINLKGEIIIDPIFDNAWHFTEGLARVNVNNKAGYINTQGEMVIEPQFVYGWGFSEGLAAVQKRTPHLDIKTNKKKYSLKWGYINFKGEMIIEPQFSSASNFHDGLALTYIGDKLAYVNKKGEIIWSGK